MAPSGLRDNQFLACRLVDAWSPYTRFDVGYEVKELSTILGPQNSESFEEVDFSFF
jgi:hypothetical protein